MIWDLLLTWSNRCDLVYVYNTIDRQSFRTKSCSYLCRMGCKPSDIGHHTNERIAFFCNEITFVNRLFHSISFICFSLRSTKTDNWQCMGIFVFYESYSGVAINIPSNRFWYVIMAGMKNEMPKTAAKICFVYLLNFHATNWMMVPKITNWKSAARYHACCIHWKE